VLTIKFSDHALLKLEILRTHGVQLSIELIQDVVTKPEKLMAGYKGRKIAQGSFDADHVLRVVYEEHHDKIVIITFYPRKRERYDED